MIVALWACIGLAVFIYFMVIVKWYLQTLHEDILNQWAEINEVNKKLEIIIALLSCKEYKEDD